MHDERMTGCHRSILAGAEESAQATDQPLRRCLQIDTVEERSRERRHAEGWQVIEWPPRRVAGLITVGRRLPFGYCCFKDGGDVGGDIAIRGAVNTTRTS